MKKLSIDTLVERLIKLKDAITKNPKPLPTSHPKAEVPLCPTKEERIEVPFFPSPTPQPKPSSPQDMESKLEKKRDQDRLLHFTSVALNGLLK